MQCFAGWLAEIHVQNCVNSQLCEHAKVTVVVYHTIGSLHSYNSSLGHGNLQSTVRYHRICHHMQVTVDDPSINEDSEQNRDSKPEELQPSPKDSETVGMCKD
jgi:hypothetical protein